MIYKLQVNGEKILILVFYKIKQMIDNSFLFFIIIIRCKIKKEFNELISQNDFMKMRNQPRYYLMKY